MRLTFAAAVVLLGSAAVTPASAAEWCYRDFGSSKAQCGMAVQACLSFARVAGGACERREAVERRWESHGQRRDRTG